MIDKKREEKKKKGEEEEEEKREIINYLNESHRIEIY